MNIDKIPYRKMNPIKHALNPISTNMYDHAPFPPVIFSSLLMQLKTRIPVLESLLPYGGAPTSSPDA